MRAIVIPGFNISDDGAGTVAKLHPHLAAEGFTVQPATYGKASLVDVRFANGNVAAMLANFLQPDDVFVTHSNGAVIACEAAKRRPDLRLHLAAITPALDSCCVFPANLGFVHVYYNGGDSPTWWARLLIAHQWGHLARVGYKGKFDGRVLSIDTGEESLGVYRATGHSGVFIDPALGYWGPNLARRAANQYTNITNKDAA